MSRLPSMIAELRGYLDELDKQLEAYETLRAERSRVQRALQALDPAPKKEPEPKTNGKLGEADTEKLGRLQEYVYLHRGEDLIANQIEPQLKDMSGSKVAQLLGVLHERGVLRLDRIAQGGGKAYRLV